MATPITLYYYLSMAGLVFPIYSLYYQWRVVKQWCMLCIGVLIVLAINAGFAFTQINWLLTAINWQAAIALAAISVLLLSVWQLVKHTYRQSLASLTNSIKAERLKRNPQIFSALLDKQEINQENLPEAKEAIQFGNPAAPYQLVIACNPYCGPCAKAHHAIEGLYERYPDNIGITIRFTLSTADEADKRTAAAATIIKAAQQKPYEAIKDWYSNMDIEKYKQLYNISGVASNGQIEKHINWSKAANISATPTVFVNGRKLPELYNWADLVPALDYALR
jgi:protein-disulfide isomerase